MSKKASNPSSRKGHSVVPINGSVFIIPDAEQGVTSSGIIIQREEQKKPESGVVAFVGLYAEIKKGTRVMFKKYEADDVELDGVVYSVCKESDIVAVLE